MVKDGGDSLFLYSGIGRNALGGTRVAGVQLVEAINGAKHEVEDHLAVWVVHA